jgi:hypothetical protein
VDVVENRSLKRNGYDGPEGGSRDVAEEGAAVLDGGGGDVEGLVVLESCNGGAGFLRCCDVCIREWEGEEAVGRSWGDGEGVLFWSGKCVGDGVL